MTRISVCLRLEVNRIDWEAMTYALHGQNPQRVRAAFDRCLLELEFMPKPKDVLERLPEKGVESKAPDNLKLIRDFYEPYSESMRLHVFEYEGGYLQVKMEKVA